MKILVSINLRAIQVVISRKVGYRKRRWDSRKPAALDVYQISEDSLKDYLFECCKFAEYVMISFSANFRMQVTEWECILMKKLLVKLLLLSLQNTCSVGTEGPARATARASTGIILASYSSLDIST